MSSKVPKKPSQQMKAGYSNFGFQKNTGKSNAVGISSRTRNKVAQPEHKTRENPAVSKNSKSPPPVRRRNLSPQKLTTTSSSSSPKVLHRPTTNLLRKSPISSSMRDLSSATSFKPSKRPTGPDRRGISEIKRSEINLRNKVDELEHHISELNQELSVSRFALQSNERKTADNQEMYEAVVEECEMLKSRGNKLEGMLEAANIDPFTLEQIKMSDGLEQTILAAEKEAQVQVETIMASLLDIDALCDKNMKILALEAAAADDDDESDYSDAPTSTVL